MRAARSSPFSEMFGLSAPLIRSWLMAEEMASSRPAAVDSAAASATGGDKRHDPARKGRDLGVGKHHDVVVHGGQFVADEATFGQRLAAQHGLRRSTASRAARALPASCRASRSAFPPRSPSRRPGRQVHAFGRDAGFGHRGRERGGRVRDSLVGGGHGGRFVEVLDLAVAVPVGAYFSRPVFSQVRIQDSLRLAVDVARPTAPGRRRRCRQRQRARRWW